MGVIIRRLQEDDVVENFDSKDEVLNNYLKKHAWTNQQKVSIGVTYIVEDESAPRIVLGYFTLATSAAPRDSFPTKHVRGLPRYDLPLILLAASLSITVSQEKGWVRSSLQKPFTSVWPFPSRSVAAASSPMPIEIRCRGMPNTASFRSKAVPRITRHNEGFWTFGL